MTLPISCLGYLLESKTNFLCIENEQKWNEHQEERRVVGVNCGWQRKKQRNEEPKKKREENKLAVATGIENRSCTFGVCLLLHFVLIAACVLCAVGLYASQHSVRSM